MQKRDQTVLGDGKKSRKLFALASPGEEERRGRGSFPSTGGRQGSALEWAGERMEKIVLSRRGGRRWKRVFFSQKQTNRG